jgi:hypothetical protein
MASFMTEPTKSAKPRVSKETEAHILWIEAHYALGRHEAALGHTLDWRARSDFVRAYIAEHSDTETNDQETY